jgi:hypothetical protein
MGARNPRKECVSADRAKPVKEHDISHFFTAISITLIPGSFPAKWRGGRGMRSKPERRFSNE